MPVGREFSTIFYNHDPVCDAAMMMNETYRVVDDRCLSTIGRGRLAQAIVSLKMCIKIKKKTSRAVVDERNGAVAIDLCIGLFISLSMANGATTKLARNTQKKVSYLSRFRRVRNRRAKRKNLIFHPNSRSSSSIDIVSNREIKEKQLAMLQHYRCRRKVSRHWLV